MTNEANLLDIVRHSLAENYGIDDCELVRLPGENLNFLVTGAAGQRCVFKIVDNDMPPEVVELESAAIEHAVYGGFAVRLPNIVQNKLGNLETGIQLPKNGPWRARMIDFIDGIALSLIPDISQLVLNSVGENLARFRRVMREFEHPAARRDHRWNLAAAGQHEHSIQRFEDRDEQALLAWAYRGWHNAVERLNRVRWQFIHGDAHDENWLFHGGRINGLIDFGDCCHNPAVSDLAICLAYLMMRGPDPLPIAAAITKGYQSVQPLSADERGVLYPLICARLAVSLCVAKERQAIDPSHPNWFAGERAAWRLLEQLLVIGADGFTRELQ